MRTQLCSYLLSVFFAAALVACGGSSTSSGDAAVVAQSKHLSRSEKTAASSYQGVVQELYIAYFGRPADPVGLTNFEAQLVAANAPADIQGLATAYTSNSALKRIVDSMGSSAESAALYGSGTTADFVNAIYSNVIGRSPGTSGLAFWQSAINSGNLTKGEAAIAIMAGALANKTAQGQVDSLLIANRVKIAEYFTSALVSRNASTSYSGSTAGAAVRAMLSGVNASTNVVTFEPTVDTTITALINVANATGMPVAGTSASQAKVSSTASAPLASPAYFVSPTGNNANPGTQALPWQTLSYGAAKLHPGDTLYAMGGTYTETVTVWVSGTSTAPITITAYPGQSPVIDGASLKVANYSSLLLLSGNYINASGFELRNINLDGHGGQGGSATVLGGFGASLQGTNNTVSNLSVHNIWSQGILASGDYSTIQDSVVHMVALSNCRIVGQTNCSAVSRSWPSCVTAASPYGSGLTTHHAVIQRNTVYNCWGEGVSTWLSTGTVIQDNVIYNNWAENLYVNNANYATVQRNLVYNTPNNYVGANAGFTLADEVTTSVAANNPVSSHNTVVNNLIYNAQFCAFCWTLVPYTGLNNDLIANNTIVNTSGAVAFSAGNAKNSIQVAHTNSTVVNNIVVGLGNVTSASGLSLSNNLWSVTPSAAAVGPGDVFGDPKLAATGSTAPGQLSTAYFQLQASSPAIGAGKTLTQVVADFVGAVATPAPDIGAY